MKMHAALDLEHLPDSPYASELRRDFPDLRFAPELEKEFQAFHLERVRFERAVEAKLRRRELSPDGNLELRLGDLRN